ncbi:MAG: hypothetical protein ACHQ7N_21565 [Candidatus Methylomirabilales bacterium]
MRTLRLSLRTWQAALARGQAIARAWGAVGSDNEWQAQLVAFVDPGRFSGTCYRVANWVRVGQTVARATAYPNGKMADGRNEIYVYPLRRQGHRLLCAEPEIALCSAPRPEAPAGWTEEEFGTVPFFGERLVRREPLTNRRDALETAVAGVDHLLLARRLAANGRTAFRQVTQRGYEGLVAKDPRATWKAGPGTG